MTDLPSSAPTPARKRRSFLVPALIVIIVALLVVIGLLWWNNRPIKPVQLSEAERTAVEAKVTALQQTPEEPRYEKGAKEIVLTERELNGLLTEHTTLADKLQFQLVTDAVHARFETDLDPDLPIVGGKRLKARARFFVKTEHDHTSLVLDDVTVWGVSLPNEWLGQLKGHDLLGEVIAGEKRGSKLAGVEEIKIERGQLKIRLAE